MLNQPAGPGGSKLAMSSQVFEGTAFGTLYLTGSAAYALMSDPSWSAIFDGVRITRVFTAASWTGQRSSFSNGDADVSVDAGTFIMNPLQGTQVTRIDGTAGAAVLTVTVDHSFKVQISGQAAGTLSGDYEVSVSAPGAAEAVDIPIGDGEGLGPSADTLSVKTLGTAVFV